MLDTNIFRHKTNANDSADLQAGARSLWNKIIEEVYNHHAVLLVPKEVVRELEVQSFTLKENQNEKIADLLEMCREIEPEHFNIDIEFSLRKLSAYIRAQHRGLLVSDKVEYLKASDARILYTAYYKDSILVTSNVKDFILYPLLFPAGEERLYCMKTNQYIKIPDDGHRTIHDDITFQGMVQDFYRLEQEAEEA